MPSHVDELARQWRRNPDEPTTIALCDAVRAEHADLILEVGTYTRDKLAASVPCLVSAARMYMRTLRLAEAQSLLVRAGKLAPREGVIYRVLGEVLLRRGDAERAEKVFERAVAFGINDSETRLWLERSRVFKPMHANAGTRAVAAEVERTAPAAAQEAYSEYDSFNETDSGLREDPTRPRGEFGPIGLVPAQPVRNVVPTYAPTRAPAHAGAAHAAPAHAAPAHAGAARLPELPLISGFGDANEATSVAPPSRGFSPRDVSAAQTWDNPTPMGLGPVAPAAPASPRGVAMDLARLPRLPSPDSSVPAPMFVDARGIPHPNASAEIPIDVELSLFNGHGLSAPAPHTAPEPAAPGAYRVAAPANPSATPPTAAELLDALALVGVFEPEAAAHTPLQWDKPKRRLRWKSALFLVFMMLAFGGGVYGTFHQVRAKRMLAHDTAERMLAQIESQLHAGKTSAFPEVEKTFGQVFDLESRSPRAALAWLQERALVGLLKGGSEIAFEDAIQRAREVKLPESSYAFAHLASSLFQGDTSGAAALLPRFDGPAEKDAYYQLFAGATLERAGSEHAVERYMAATRLDPELVAAHVALVRLLALSGDAAKAAALAKEFRAKYPDRAEGAALVALTWARDPARSEKPPPEVNEAMAVLANGADLPLPLQVVPRAIKALGALDARAPVEAKTEIENGLKAVDSPGVAVWLGNMAISLGDEQLARKAALVAVSFSAFYPPARVLAARVALLGDRLDEAQKATEGLEPSPEVALVHAAAAYEKLDTDGLDRALLALPEAARKSASLLPMVTAQEALAGRARLNDKKLLELAGADTPWSDLVAMDLALDHGDLETAKKISAPWKTAEKPPVHARAVRLSRLARYDGRLDEADEASRTALAGGTTTARGLFERVLVLVARGKASEVGPLLAKQGQILGPMATWLSAYAVASANKLDDARGRTASLDPPPELAPLPSRIAAALALGTMKDARRGYAYIKALYDLGVVDPDTTAAGAPLGMRPPQVWRK
ncbi:hypothetical protein [Pendulispora albinea]|uniref:Tetratricopeptide repeat protein n=1 Tax=Pendulispora albinea TaxID=2741071 RepID=A0ABZ2M2H2_9BACT